MSAKSALIWVSVAIAIIVILYISYIVYKKFIAKYFDESIIQQRTLDREEANAQPLAERSHPPTNPSLNTTEASAPNYSEACMPPLAPPTYEEAISSSK